MGKHIDDLKCNDPNCDHIYGDHDMKHGTGVGLEQLIQMIADKAFDAHKALTARPISSEGFNVAEKRKLAALDDMTFSLLLGDQAEENPMNEVTMATAILDAMAHSGFAERVLILTSLIHSGQRKGILVCENAQENEARKKAGTPEKTLLDVLKEGITQHAG